MTDQEKPHKPNDHCYSLLSFFASPMGVLKILEVVLLAVSMVLFLAGLECVEWPVHEVLFGLLLSVCTVGTFVTFVLAGKLAHQGSDPITDPTCAIRVRKNF